MGLIRGAGRRVRSGVARRLGLVDAAVAAALAVGGLSALGNLHFRGPAALAAVSCVIATGAVGLRKRAPQTAEVASVTAVVVYQSITRDPQGAFVSAALVLVGYGFGRFAVRDHRYVRIAVVLAYCLAVLEVGLYPSHQSSPAGTAGTWFTIVVLPAVVGAAVERRDQLARRLADAAGRLQDEQMTQADRAAAEERNRVARELHDVVAHHLSVMTIQAGAARTVADRPEAAATALRTVADAGRDALAELRRITGVLRRPDDRWDGHQPSLQQLDALADRTRVAGVAVDMHVSGDLSAVPPGVDLAAYRIVQEALTNVVKHAATTTAHVDVGVRDDALTVSVTNDGNERGMPQPLPSSGQGLIGMRERVDLYGGHLSAGPTAGGGFEVRATMPLQPTVRSRPLPTITTRPARRTVSMTVPTTVRRLGRPALRSHVDALLAAFWFVALETEALTSHNRHGSVTLNIAVVAAMTVIGVWRRRWPIAFLIAVGLLAVPLADGLTTLRTATITGTYVLLVPIGTIAVSSGLAGAVTALAMWEAALIGVGAFTHAPTAAVAGAVMMTGIVWVAARVWRSYRELHRELAAAVSRLEAEASERGRLAVANQRALIAQDLNGLVARHVVAMVVQARAAETDCRPGALGAAAGVIEATGREALGRMRDILGVLRAHTATSGPLPAPALAPDWRSPDSAWAPSLAPVGGKQP